jgi:hypothetical protein
MTESTEGSGAPSPRFATARLILSWLDLLLGIAALCAAIGFLARLPRDAFGFGLLFSLVLFPYALLALAAWRSMRAGDRGRWILQTLTLLPLVLLGFVVWVLDGGASPNREYADHRDEAMSSPLTTGGPPPITYFTEAVPGTATLRLAAAVVLRGVPTPGARLGGGGPLGWLRGVRQRLWLRLGPLGYDVSVAGRPLFGGPWGAARSIANAGVPTGGEPVAYYDDLTRTMRVLGRVVRAPKEGAVVALIDATGRRAASPRLVLRVVPVPTIPVPHFDSMPPQQEGAAVGYMAVSHFMISDEPTWDTALRADPVVRAFLNGERTD